MNRTSRILSILSIGLSLGCSAQNGGPPTSGPSSRPSAKNEGTPSGEKAQEPVIHPNPLEAGSHAAFDDLLSAVVRNERVDYRAVRASHMDALGGYLDELAAVDPSKLARDERLAHYINLYNATMIHVIAQRWKQGYSTAENDYGVFKEELVRTKSGAISLNHLENEIIRPEFKEPRIHVALVCGARSCPPIVSSAYTADNLEKLLEANMVRFIKNDPFRNVIEPKRVRLSQIFNWYKVDFGGDEGLLKYVGKYAGRDLTGAEVEFLDYSWDLNIAEPVK